MLTAEYKFHEERGFPCLVVKGRISANELPKFEAHLGELKGRAEGYAILDLELVPYLTSRGFPTILTLKQDLSALDSHLYVAASKELRELFDVLRLSSRIRLFSRRPDCILAALAQRG